jgi:hypothetical protein
MNEKVVKYCSKTLKKMIDYHIQNEKLGVVELLEINHDLKRLMTVNEVNIFRIKQYDRLNDVVFFHKLRDMLCEKYIKNDIVRQWLFLFINNPEIDFDEILEAADKYNSKTLEILITIKSCIDLNNERREQIINSTLVRVKNETINENDYQFFIVYLKDECEEKCSQLFSRERVNEIENENLANTPVSKNEMLNTIFDYFIINKTN